MSDPVTPLPKDEFEKDVSKAPHDGYIHKELVAFDQFANVTLGGTPDETISSRVARWDTEDKGIKREIGKIISEGLGLIQHDHGAKAEAGDLGRAEEVERIENSTSTVKAESD